jgi:hypothetical protein
VHAADTGQLGLSGARFEHHVAEQITSAGHDSSIALYAIGRSARKTRFAKFRGGALATDWQHQNRKRPNSASNDQPLKLGLTCSFVDFHLRPTVVFWLSGGGSASSNLAGSASETRRELGQTPGDRRGLAGLERCQAAPRPHEAEIRPHFMAGTPPARERQLSEYCGRSGRGERP